MAVILAYRSIIINLNTPEGWNNSSPGCQPGVEKKNQNRFGGIFVFFTKIVTKHKRRINSILQNYKQMNNKSKKQISNK